MEGFSMQKKPRAVRGALRMLRRDMRGGGAANNLSILPLLYLSIVLSIQKKSPAQGIAGGEGFGWDEVGCTECVDGVSNLLSCHLRGASWSVFGAGAPRPCWPWLPPSCGRRAGRSRCRRGLLLRRLLRRTGVLCRRLRRRGACHRRTCGLAHWLLSCSRRGNAVSRHHSSTIEA
jgi:hypothetical protein